MAQDGNGNAQRKPAPVPLTVIDEGSDDISEDDTFIVVGEAGEDVAFEICEDLNIAMDVREAMLEDGFAVRVFQANEVEVVTDEDEPTPGPGGRAA